jgi:hypothetical protein
MSARRAPPPYPRLSGLRCCLCGQRGVSIVMMIHAEDAEPEEHLYCTPGCAAGRGWPWLRTAIAKRRRVREPALDG